jgi:hypothetical protein
MRHLSASALKKSSTGPSANVGFRDRNQGGLARFVSALLALIAADSAGPGSQSQVGPAELIALLVVFFLPSAFFSRVMEHCELSP